MLKLEIIYLKGNLQSNAGYLGCQQLVEVFNGILYSIKNKYNEAFNINEFKYQNNKLYWKG